MTEEHGRQGSGADLPSDLPEEASVGPTVAIEIMPRPEEPVPDPATREADTVAPRWPPFSVDGITYGFEHLVDFTFACSDSGGVERKVSVSFTDHVFTRDTVAGDRPEDAFPGCSRTPTGHLCPVRYRMSSQLPALIERAVGSRVWMLTGNDRYAQVPVVDNQGAKLLYAIIFTLDPVKGLEHPLRMLIRSAHLCDRKPPDTFGEVRFPHLVKLRVQKQHPKRNHDRNRKRPKMP